MTREKQVKCFSSAADYMKGPDGFRTLPAFLNSRWSLASEQRDERMRTFGYKLLRRLDSMDMPFCVSVGLMSPAVARQRYVTGVDPWTPGENPYLDGVAMKFRHVFHNEMPGRCWILFAEIAFDVARLAQVPVAWGGFSDRNDPGYFQIWERGDGQRVDARTYGSRLSAKLDYDWD